MNVRRLLLAFLILFTASIAKAGDIYFGPTAVGAANGIGSCANARALSSHIIGDDVPGNTLHVCPGIYTFSAGSTSAFKFLASGTSGNLITLKGEVSGITFTAPGWSQPTIDLNGQNFIAIDGGSLCGQVNWIETPCNLTLTSTNSGTGLSQTAQSANGFAIGTVAGAVHDVSIKNVGISNWYIHKSSVAVTNATWSSGTATVTLSSNWPCVIGNVVSVNSVLPSGYQSANVTITGCPAGNQIQYAIVSNPGTYTGFGFIADEKSAFCVGLLVGNNFIWDHNYLHDCDRAIKVNPVTSTTDTNYTFSNSVYFNMNHGIDLLTNGNTILTNVNIFGNITRDVANWDDQAPSSSACQPGNCNGQNNFHHDHYQIGPNQATDTATNWFMYNNWMGGAPGQGSTAFLFFDTEVGGNNSSNIWVFNSVFDGIVGGTADGYLYMGNAANVYNNTFRASICSNCGFPAYHYFNGTNFSTFANNIVINATYGVYMDTVSQKVKMDFNDFFNNNNNTRNCSPGSTCVGLGGTGNPNLNSVSGNPQLNGATVPALQFINTTSAGYRTGTNLSSLGITALNSDLLGIARGTGSVDMGAYYVNSGISVPAVPTGLLASVAGSTVNLSCSGSTGTPTGYNFSRATVSGGPYTLIASPSTCSFADTGLSNGTYYYVVNAFNSAGTSANSTQISATVSTACSINLNPSSLAFGSVTQGTASATQSITITNLGTATCTSVSVANPSNPDFGQTNICGSSLAINATCSATVTFTPSIVGNELSALAISSNDPASPETAPLSGTGVAAINITPISVTLTNTYVTKTSASAVVTVVNNSGSSVTFSSIAFSGGSSAIFNVDNTPVGHCTGTIANGTSCTITFSATPVSNGNFSSTLVITDSDIGSPHNIAVTVSARGHKVLKIGAVI